MVWPVILSMAVALFTQLSGDSLMKDLPDQQSFKVVVMKASKH